jgi:hypothetical protein
MPAPGVTFIAEALGTTSVIYESLIVSVFLAGYVVSLDIHKEVDFDTDGNTDWYIDSSSAE